MKYLLYWEGEKNHTRARPPTFASQIALVDECLVANGRSIAIDCECSRCANVYIGLKLNLFICIWLEGEIYLSAESTFSVQIEMAMICFELSCLAILFNIFCYLPAGICVLCVFIQMMCMCEWTVKLSGMNGCSTNVKSTSNREIKWNYWRVDIGVCVYINPKKKRERNERIPPRSHLHL